MTASENSRSTIFQESLVLPFKLNAFTSGTSWQHMHFNLVGISLQFWQLHHSWELILLCRVSGSRSSCSDMICKKGVLRNFTRFTGKHLSQRCFTVSFAKFLRAPFCYRTPPLAASRKIFQILAWKYLLCVQKKVFGVFIFPYFVLSWYMPVQSMELFFFFLFTIGIYILFKLIDKTRQAFKFFKFF